MEKQPSTAVMNDIKGCHKIVDWVRWKRDYRKSVMYKKKNRKKKETVIKLGLFFQFYQSCVDQKSWKSNAEKNTDEIFLVVIWTKRGKIAKICELFEFHFLCYRSFLFSGLPIIRTNKEFFYRNIFILVH